MPWASLTHGRRRDSRRSPVHPLGRAAHLIDARSWAATAALVGAGVAAVLLAARRSDLETLDLSTLIALALCAGVAELQGTRLSGRLVVSAGASLSVLAAITVGPLGAAIVGLCAMFGDVRPPLARWLSYAGLYVAAGVAGGLAALAVDELDRGRELGTYAVQAFAAAVAVFGVNLVGNTVIAVVRRIRPIADHLRMVVTAAGSGAFFATPIVAALAFGYGKAGLAVLLFTMIPLLAANALLRLYADKTALAERFAESNMALAFALIRALDARDAYTAGHSAAVAVYARDLADAAGLPPQDVSGVHLAALLHDVGKIGVPTEVLNKPGRLSPDEWRAIREHPLIGERIAGEASMFGDVPRVIRHHHERQDGLGYPDGLPGTAIPEASAIIGLADAYNAMTQSRAYRPALEPDVAMVELQRCSGAQFPPHLVDLFVALLRSRDDAYRRAVGPEFSLDGQRDAILAESRERRAMFDLGAAVA